MRGWWGLFFLFFGLLGSGKLWAISPFGYSPIRIVGALGEPVYLAERVFFRKQPYLFYLTHKALRVQRFRGTENHAYRPSGEGRIVSFSVGPQGYLALVFFDQSAFFSKILHFAPGRGFAEMVSRSPYILCFLDFDGDGVNETLVGHTLGMEDLLPGRPMVFQIQGRSLHRVRVLDWSEEVFLFSSFAADLNFNRVPEVAYFNEMGTLYLMERGRKIWKAPQALGKSIFTVTFPSDDISHAGALRIPPKAVLFSYRGWHMLALPYNRFSGVATLFSKPRESGVAFLWWDRGFYRLAYFTGFFRGAVQGVFILGEDLYVIVVEEESYSEGGRSQIYAMPLFWVLQNSR